MEGEEEDYAVKKPTTKSKEMRSEYRDWLQHRLRARVVEAIELDSVYCDRILGCLRCLLLRIPLQERRLRSI